MAETKSDIHLYTAATPNGIKVSILLEELGLPYKVTTLDFSKNEQKEPWFLEINPNGRIPALTDTFTDGKPIRLFESGSILQYLVERYDTEHKVSYPIGSREYYEVNNWLHFQMAGLGPMQGQANHFFRYAPEKIPYGINRYQNETRRLYGVLNTHLEKSSSGFLVGDRLTIADIASWGWVSAHHWAGISLDDFPHLNAWLEKLLAREGVEKGRHVPKRHTALDMRNKSEEELEKEAAKSAAWVQQGMANDAKKTTVKMAWRNQGITGSNNIPLGKARRFGADGEEVRGSMSPVTQSNGHSNNDSSERPVSGIDRDVKRGRSPERGDDGQRRRKKRNRWGDATENKAAGLMGLPTAIVANMTSEQLEAYTLHLRIEEITQKLKIDDVVPADGDRSPSPAPQYDNHGRRVNTREYRYRKRLEDERHKLIERAIKVIPNYHPPQDYRRPTKTQEKVYVPVNDYPEINFIGLLIGPRGNTLKKMETESGAKIAIRGKGSVKEGKGRSDAAHSSNQEEDLHCLIMADTEEKVNKAKKLIHNIIETAASIPEGQNELKRNQLRELAALNGTLRDDENQACQNCGQIGHRKYDCPEKQNFTASIICRVCGNAGHMARDCPDRQRGASWRNDGPPNRTAGRIGAGGAGGGGDAVDREYEQLMQELGGTGAAPAMIEAGPGSHGNGGGGSGGDSRPWANRAPPTGPTGGPAPWRTRNQDNDHDGGFSRGPPSGPSGGPAPWARDRGDRGDRDRDDRGDRGDRGYRGGGGRDRDGRDGGDSYYGGGGGGGGHNAYGGGSSAPGTAPWNQPPAAPAYGGGYPGYAGYGAPPGMAGAPPGLPPPPPGAAPPGLPSGLNALIQQYANAVPPPPPPPAGDAPPPPPRDLPPPPPPPGA
ncbi:zinc knuckle transcription factor splicing factor msl5 [Podospora australis]|uniref:Branchpoint-bridging protein n=1 Tax=Podospora australis TaxID=1536484 RepID=A0AAN6X7X0_9PEZI|nr:zinc knuckle transcription factor splicing factor msl5 [Podospora australis]